MKKVNGEFTRTNLGHIPHRAINFNGFAVIAPVKVLISEPDGFPAPMRSGMDLIYALPGGGEIAFPAPDDIKYLKIGEVLC
jgi:hypothetical protein